MRSKVILTFFFWIFCSILLYSQSLIETGNHNIIPFEYYRRHIYIKGTINGVNGNFVFDTGAENLYFDTLFYRESGLKYDSISTAKLPGAGRKFQNVKVIMNRVEFNSGDHYYLTRDVALISLKPILGDFADGVLGVNYFSDKLLEINYIHKFIRILDSIDSSMVRQYTRIQCYNMQGRLYLPVVFNINESVSISDKFAFDLGFGRNVMLTSPVALKFNLDKVITNKVGYYTSYGGIGGESESNAFTAKSIEIGGYKLNHFEAGYSKDKSGSLSSTKHAGLLGNEIFERFDVIIDFKNSCLYIKPNISFSSTFKFSRLGFSFVDRRETLGALVVSGFFKNSHAETSGLHIDDKIIEINNMPVIGLDFQKLEEFINAADRLMLKVESGNELLNIEIIQNQIFNNE